MTNLHPLPPINTPTGWLHTTNESVSIGGRRDEDGRFHQWFACAHPERPWAPETSYHISPKCRSCLIAMRAHRENK